MGLTSSAFRLSAMIVLARSAGLLGQVRVWWHAAELRSVASTDTA